MFHLPPTGPHRVGVRNLEKQRKTKQKTKTIPTYMCEGVCVLYSHRDLCCLLYLVKHELSF